MGTGDGGHPDEVVGPGEKCPERGGNGGEPDDLESDRRSNHELLGDEDLDEAVRRLLLEELGIGRVGNLTVDDDQIGAGVRQGGKRLAERPSGRQWLGEGGPGVLLG